MKECIRMTCAAFKPTKAVPGTGRAIAIGLALALVGCNGHSGGGGASATDNPSGLTYHLAKDVIEVSGTATYKKTNKVNDNLVIDEGTYAFAGAKVAVEIRTVADPDAVYSIDLSHGILTKDDFKAVSGSTGILTSVNAEQTGRAGEVIKNVANLASSLVAPAIGFDIKTVDKPLSADELFEAIEAFKEIKTDRELAKSQFQQLSPLERLYLAANDQGARHWRDLFLMARAIAKQRVDRKRLQQDLAGASSYDLSLVTVRVRGISAAIETLQEERAVLLASYQAGLASFKKQKKIDTFSKEFQIREFLAIADLPRDGVVKPGMSPAEVTEALRGDDEEKPLYPKALSLWNQARVVLTIETFGTEQKAKAPEEPQPDRCVAGNTKDDLVICYRRPRPLILSRYEVKNLPNRQRKEPKPGNEPAPDSEADASNETKSDKVPELVNQLVLNSRSVENLVGPSSKTVSVALNKSNFAQRKLTLTMGTKGELTELARVSESSAEALSGSLSSAAQSSLDNLQKSFETVQKIAQARDGIRLDRLQDEVNRLTAEKELVDARINLDGANASADLVRRKNELDAQLETREAELKLANAETAQQLQQLKDQAALADAQLALDQKSATAQLLLGQQILEAELNNLRNEIAIDTERATAEDQRSLRELDRELDLLKRQIEILEKQSELQGQLDAQ